MQQTTFLVCVNSFERDDDQIAVEHPCAYEGRAQMQHRSPYRSSDNLVTSGANSEPIKSVEVATATALDMPCNGLPAQECITDQVQLVLALSIGEVEGEIVVRVAASARSSHPALHLHQNLGTVHGDAQHSTLECWIRGERQRDGRWGIGAGQFDGLGSQVAALQTDVETRSESSASSIRGAQP